MKTVPVAPKCKTCGRPMKCFAEDHDEDRHPRNLPGQAVSSLYLYRCDDCKTGGTWHSPHWCVDHDVDLVEHKEIIITTGSPWYGPTGASIYSDLRCPKDGCPAHAVAPKVGRN